MKAIMKERLHTGVYSEHKECFACKKELNEEKSTYITIDDEDVYAFHIKCFTNAEREKLIN